jgi:hypothetical protein
MACIVETTSIASRRFADAFAAGVMPMISRLRSTGITAPAAIAAELSHWGVPCPNGKVARWSASMVRKVIRRAQRFTSDFAITVEDDAGDLDLVYQETDGEVVLAFA